MSPLLVTGCAGFIGFHLAARLLDDGQDVVGIDNLNNYYDVELKLARLRQLQSRKQFQFEKVDLADRAGIERVFAERPPRRVVHLGAQAGVRYSLENPHEYVSSNLTGFLHILEGCRRHQVEHLVYASSSSVYGANTRMPFSTHDNVDHPVSLYAATKKANELMAHSYSSLYGIPATGLRFFTVYGPWGRPDMALFLFTKAMLEGTPIKVFNHGQMKRDFTYVDDVVEGMVRVLAKPAASNPEWTGIDPDPASSRAPHRVYNIGNSEPVPLLTLIELLERNWNRPALKNMLPMAAGDVLETFADVSDLERDVGYRPQTPIETGIAKFVEWYRSYYKITT